jgi:hypothetical protein
MDQLDYESTIIKEERIWRKLAKSQKLKFVASRLNNPETRVKGSYQGHYLSLKTLEDEFTDLYTLISLKKKRPLETEVKGPPLAALDKLIAAYPLRGIIGAEPGGDPIFYKQLGFETDKGYIRPLFQLLYELLILYPQITELGGQVIPSLQKIRQNHQLFHPICTRMMADIGQATIERLKKIALEIWCPHCLARFKAIEISLPEEEPKLYYYGCRACGQSREILHLKEGITAILDNAGTVEQFSQGEGLTVNCLHHRSLFDFDRVEIVQATDEEVERFAVSLGNDTDKIRRACYQGMDYTISPSCELSTNTLRVLQYTFRAEEYPSSVRLQVFGKNPGCSLWPEGDIFALFK